MNTVPSGKSDPQQVSANPKAVATRESQTLSGAELKEIVQQGLSTWGEVHARDIADRENQRVHEFKSEELQYLHLKHENDAERAVEERTDRRALAFAFSIVFLLVVVSVILVFNGYAVLAGKIVNYAVIFAAGLGVGQTRPLRALLGPKRRMSERNDNPDKNSAD